MWRCCRWDPNKPAREEKRINANAWPQMKRIAGFVFAVAVFVALRASIAAAQGSFTLEQVLGVPFHSNLVAAESGNRIAWTSNQQGKRNIWVAEGPNFAGRQLTSYSDDDGGELDALQFSADGGTLVYSRGKAKTLRANMPTRRTIPEGRRRRSGRSRGPAAHR